MALSKTIKAALDAWKEGKGEFPEALDTGVHFENDGAFMSAVDSKAKKREQAARETATAELLEKLGITDAAEIDEIKAKLESTKTVQSEVEKHKGNADKTAKELSKSQQKIADLTSKLHGLAKGAALMPFASQVRDTEALGMFVSPHLEVDENGTVTGKDGKTVEEIVKGVLKAKEYLANPEFKAGAGTKAQGPKANLPFRDTGTDGKSSLTVGQAIANELVAQGKLAPPVNGAG